MANDKNKEIYYPNLKDLYFLFGLIEKIKYPQDEQIPDYQSEPEAIEEALGAIKRSSEFYYTSLEEKAAYVFVSIAQGHFFINGNKRLAVGSALMFLGYNDCFLTMDEKESKETCFALFNKIFPEVIDSEDILNDVRGLDVLQQLLYLISFIAVEAKKYGYDFEQLKTKVKEFFKDFFYCS